MNRLLMLLVVAIPCLFGIGSSQGPDELSSMLNRMVVDQLGSQWESGAVSMNARLYTTYWNASYSDEWQILKLDGKYLRFLAAAGIKDGRNPGHASIKIWVDGKSVLSQEVTNGAITPVDLDIERASSMKIELENCILANPAFGVPKPVERIQLLEPKKGATVKKNVVLRWSPSEGATAYVVEVVSSSLNADLPDAERIYCYTAKRGATALTVNLANYAPGTYLWSVAPCGAQKLLDSFGDQSSFVVTR